MSYIQQITTGGGTGGGRTKLTTNTTYYVSTTGNDSGNGSVGNPWRTLQHACDFIATNIDFNGFDIGVSIADGAYDGFYIGAMVASLGSLTAKTQNTLNNALLTFFSASVDYTKVLIGVYPPSVGSCILFDSYCPVIACIKNVTVDCQAVPQGAAINVGAGAIFAVGDGNGGTVRLLGDPIHVNDTGEPLSVNTNGFLILNDTVLLDGGLWDYFINMAQGGGRVQLGNGVAIGSSNSVTINFANSPQGNRFINSIDNGYLTAPGGSVTIGAGAGAWAYKFHLSILGGIDLTNVLGADLTFFPGTSIFSGGAEYAWNDGIQDRIYPGDFFSVLKSGSPTASDLTAGTNAIFKDTTQPAGFGNALYVNDMGTIINLTPKYFLNSNTTFYVSSGGSDFNNGLSAAHPWATLQHAVNILATNVDANGFAITVQIADGTYVGFVMNGAPQGIGAYYQFVGNVTTPANVIIHEASAGGACFSINTVIPTTLQFSGLAITPITGGTGFSFGVSGVGAIAKCIFDGSTATNGFGVFLSNDFYSIGVGTDVSGVAGGGGVGNSWKGTWGAMVVSSAIVDGTLTGPQTLIGTPSWTGAGVVANSAGAVIANGNFSFTGTAIGKRFIIDDGGEIIADGTGNLNFYPGSTPGTVGNGNYDGTLYDKSFPLPTYDTTLPASDTATGTPFTFTFDTSGNLYFCYSTNKWAKYTNVAPFSNVSGQQDAQPLGMP